MRRNYFYREDLQVELTQLQLEEEDEKERFLEGSALFEQKPENLFEIGLDYRISENLGSKHKRLVPGYVALEIKGNICRISPILYPEFRGKGYWKEARDLLLERIFKESFFREENERRVPYRIDRVEIGTTVVTKEEFLQTYYKDDIYVVMYAYYSDWTIYGYFTRKSDAEKYCTAHPEMDLTVETLHCLDHKQDLSKVSVKYQYLVRFRLHDKTWCLDPPFQSEEAGEPEAVGEKTSRYVIEMGPDPENPRWIRIKVTLERADRSIAEKTAQDLFYQYLNFCENHPNEKSAADFLSQM